MNYAEALRYLDRVPKFSPKEAKKAILENRNAFKLDTIKALLAKLGNPQDQLKYIHVAGTNGKGSTVAFLNSILTESGLKVGVFTSPFLQSYLEMIKVGHQEISEQDFARILSEIVVQCKAIESEVNKTPSEFEIRFAIAILYYVEQGCDVVILEVGLGGRLDATNIIKQALLAVITSISYDHMEVLGNTLEQIAREKAGIIKENYQVLVYPQAENIVHEIKQICLDKNAEFHVAKLPQVIQDSELGKHSFRLSQYAELDEINILMQGQYQLKNAALAVQAAMLLKEKLPMITNECIKMGMEKARWAGRFEVLHRNPWVIIDGSHNMGGVDELISSLGKYFPNQKVRFILGVLEDKPYQQMFEAIMPLAKKCYGITVDSPRALKVEKIKSYFQTKKISVESYATINQAIEAALADSTTEDVVCAFGSLYYIGEVRSYFQKRDNKSKEASIFGEFNVI